MFQCFHNQHKKIVVQLKLSPFSLQVACVKHVRNRARQTSSLLWRVCFHMYLFSFTPCNEKGFKWRHLPSTAGVLIAIVWCLWVSYDALWTNTVMMNMCSKIMWVLKSHRCKAYATHPKVSILYWLWPQNQAELNKTPIAFLGLWMK